MSPALAASPSAHRHGDPESATLAFARALNAGSVSAATACFTRDACFLTPDATTVHGPQRIGAVLAQLVAMRPRIDLDMQRVLRAGEVALLTERWTVRFGPRSDALVQSLSPSYVLCRVQGEWKLAVAAPWGWDG